ncbi:glutamine amidotransferases class-II family protein [Acinetobacter sp. 272263]|nr:glutamine amidotransferases class-II family protein [Acinetobacter sp. 272263]
MCGIVGGVAERNIINILIEGLKRLEYRGYDSAGVALLHNGQIVRERRVGKVAMLEEAVRDSQISGSVVLLTRAGPLMVNRLKIMLTRISLVMLQLFIMVLLRITRNSKMT